MSSDDVDKDSSLFKSDYYFHLGDAVDELKDSFQYGDAIEKAKTTSKLVGKSVFNLGVFAGKLGKEVIQRLPENIEKTKK